MWRRSNLYCATCETHLPPDSYALVEGVYYCLRCFIDQHTNHETRSIVEEIDARTRESNSEINKLGFTTSLKSTQSNKRVGTADRVGAAVARAFRHFLSASPTSTTPANHQKPPRPSKTRNQTCQVCFDEKSSKHFRSILNHVCCQDQRTVCDACIYQHIQQSFQEMCTDDVRCPELECGLKLQYDTIKSILNANKDNKLFERYDRFVIHHQLEQMEEFIWCSNPKCQMGQLNDGGQANNIVRCIYCRKKTCFTHKTPWHQDMTCEEYDSIINDDVRASLQWLNQNTKTCPKCPYQIEKNEGCDHMICIKCQYEFCWSCLADYDRIRRDGNHRHHPNCKHYAAYDEATESNYGSRDL